MGRTRQQSIFTMSKKPAQWLDWEAVQRARAKAQLAYKAYTGNSGTRRLFLTRDVLVMMLFTHQPPDRVGVLRLLRLGETLKRTHSGFELDLTQPGSHKTSAIFGPSRTTISKAIAAWIDSYISTVAEFPRDRTAIQMNTSA